MMPNRYNTTRTSTGKGTDMGDVVPFPNRNQPSQQEEETTPAIDAEMVDDTPTQVSATAERLDQKSTSPTPAPTGGGIVYSTVTSGKPLTVDQAGGRYHYVVDVARSGAKRLPMALLDGVANRIKLAHLREGGTHRGEILPQNRNAYASELQRRRERRAAVAKAVFTKKIKKTSKRRGGKVATEGTRPRLETTLPVAAEAATVAYPTWPGAGLVHNINAGIGDFVGGLLSNGASAVSDAVLTPLGLATTAAAAAGVTGWQAMAEHRDRQSTLAALMSADGNADLMPDEPADYLTAAFRSVGIIKTSTANTPGQRIDLLRPIESQAECWTAYIQLPKGPSAKKVRARHEELAGALDSDTDRVLILDGETDRQVIIRVYEKLPMSGNGAEYPLATASVFDIWDGVPFGTDLFGNPVRVDVTSTHSFSAGATRNGKTFSERVKVSAAVLDPHVTISVADFKPAGDWAPIRKIAHDFIQGTEDDALTRLRDMLKAAQGECSRRMGLLTGEAGEKHGAEGQINRSMARDSKLGCSPWLIIIDEVQRATGDPQSGDRDKDSIYLEIYNLIDDIARRGAAVGVLLVMSTQKPDGNILKGSTWDQLGNRFCLSVPNKTTSDVVLGSGAAGEGADASTLIDRKQKGAGQLQGAVSHEEKYVLTKSYNVPKTMFAELCERGREARRQLNTLPKSVFAVQDQVGSQGQGQLDETPNLGEREEAFIRVAGDIYRDDDHDWINARDLYREVVEGELDWTRNKTTEMVVSGALSMVGVRKEKGTREVEGRRTTLTFYSRADLVAAADQIEQAA